ncbi:sin3b, putative, partial [Ixodes scapularis]
VEDALSYLDQVKFRFGNQPQVYNDFLDIMKEFKSQSIDTPGVIQRVSNLFKGHPELIVGFNTFLPPGYRIEVQANEQVNVSMPGSLSTTITAGGITLATTTSVAGPSAPGAAPSPAGPNAAPPPAPAASSPPSGTKNRFQGQPDIYKQFLEILHTYQKEQRNLKETGGKPLTESEVYAQVAKLFQNQEDLLQEFGQFLPDANGASTHSLKPGSGLSKPSLVSGLGSSLKQGSTPLKRPLSHLSGSKQKMTSLKDVTLAEAGKHGTLNEFAFFDKVRRALRGQEVYENFLRCLILYNQEIVSRSELVHLVTPFLGKFPELFKWFKDFIGYKDLGGQVEPIPNKVRRSFSFLADYSSCKRYGASYRALPKNIVQPKCSGRTQLCKEVLNDTWVSFPSWSEDSTFVSSRKTQYEEYIYRCEDERFEVGLPTCFVLFLHPSFLRGFVFRIVRPPFFSFLHLDISESRLLALFSCFKRIALLNHIFYGIFLPHCMIEFGSIGAGAALVAVSWRFRTSFWHFEDAFAIWARVLTKVSGILNHSSLDPVTHSKTAIGLFIRRPTQRREQMEEGTGEVPVGPHMTLPYLDRSILDDAANLIIHHVKRQTGINKEDKQKIKQLLRQFIPDLFCLPRGELGGPDEGCEGNDKSRPRSSSEERNSVSEMSRDQPSLMQNLYSDDSYALFFVNDHWYLFFRLHHLLCERLTKIYRQSTNLAADEAKDRKDRKESTAGLRRSRSRTLAIFLTRCACSAEIEVEDYYLVFLDMVKSLLDGNMDSTQYEDTLREMFGIHAYTVFTLDKVVQNAVRQLQHIMCDEVCLRCTELFLEEHKVGAAGGPCSSASHRAHLEGSYQKKAEQALVNDTCFKLVLVSAFESTLMEKRSRNVRARRQQARKQEREAQMPAASAVGESHHSNNGTNNKSPCTNDESTNDEAPFTPAAVASPLGATVPAKTDVADDTQCRFNLSSYKMVFVVNSSSYIYNHRALRRARQSHRKVSERMHRNFGTWHRSWLDKNVSNEQDSQCEDWLQGLDYECITHCIKVQDCTRPPYCHFRRFRTAPAPPSPSNDDQS